MVDKTETQHTDIFGRQIVQGNAVAYCRGNMMYIGTVGRVTQKMMRVHPLKGYGKKDGYLVYPNQTVLVDGPEATMYVLKNSG